MNSFSNYTQIFLKTLGLLVVLTVPHVLHGQALPTTRTDAELQADADWNMTTWNIEEVERAQEEWKSKELPGPVERSDLIPTQGKKTIQTSVTSTIGQCVGDLLANVATKWFTSVVSSVVASVTKPTLVPVYVPGLENKEVSAAGVGPSLDSIGYCLGNALIQTVSDSTIKWIHSGFKGNPTFIDDPESFFKDFKEDTLNAFVDSFADGILCKEFSIQVRLALIEKSRPKRQYKCTYDEALYNLENQPFSFELYAAVANVPGNNPIGAFLSIDSNYNELLNSREDALKLETTWGRGYLSWKDKDNPGKTITPGTFVSDSLQKATGIKFDRLVLADEFDEVLGALINQLILGAINEVMGTP